MIPTGTSITGGIMTRTGSTGGGSSPPTVVTWTSTDEALKISVRTGVGVIIKYSEQCGAWEAPVGGLTPVQHQAGPPPTPAVTTSRQPETGEKSDGFGRIANEQQVANPPAGI